MSITLTHGGLPNGIGRLALFDTFESVARVAFGISATGIRLLKHHISKCRDSDFLPGRICGTWEQPQQTATALGISTRELNNAERELISASLIHRTATPHVRRDGRRSGDRITFVAGINLAPVIDRALNLWRFDQLRNCKKRHCCICEERSLTSAPKFGPAKIAILSC